ncbi:MAG: hypothetical protein ABL932_21120 [Terricaulis sp.]
MPVVLRHNDVLELNVAEYHGAVSFGELKGVADYMAANSSFLKYDCLSVVFPGCRFDGIAFDALNELFGRYKGLYEPMTFQIIRRSAWICFSPAAQAHVDHWSGKREAREAMSTTLQQFASFEEAGDWLVLSEAETLAVQNGAGFHELTRFEDTPIPQARAS